MGKPFWESDEIVSPATPKATEPGNSYFWSKDEIVAPKADKPGMVETAARAAARGLTFGLNDEALGVMKGIGGLVTGEGFGPAYDRAVEGYRARDKAAATENPITNTVSEIAGGMGTGLGAMRAGATLMRGGMGLPQAMAASAVEGAGYGALHGAGNAEGGVGERVKAAQQGGITGAAVGGAVPLIARGISAATRAVTPMAVAPERQAMAAVLEREGVPMTAGQITGSKALAKAESILGDAPFAGGGASRIVADQTDAFTDAAMRRAGARGLATPENIDGTFVRLGQQFNDLSARNTLRADPQLGQELGGVLREYDRVLTPDRRQIIGDLATDIVERFRVGGGTMPGRDYQTIRSRLTKRAQGAGTDTDYRNAARGLRDALDNAMDRSIRTDDAGLWAETRRQYGNLKDIAKASGGAGEGTAYGRVTPQSLRGAIATGRNREAYARGQGDLAELVRAGNAMMTPLPNSGTPAGMAALSVAGGSAGFAAGGVEAAILAAALPAMAGRAITAPWTQRYLSNQAIGPATRRAIEQHLRAATQGGAQTQSPKLRLPSLAR